MLSPSFMACLSCSWVTSGPAPPEGAVAPQDEREVLLVSGPALVLRQLQLLLDAVPALARLGLGLHRGRCVLQERQLILNVLLGTEPPAGRTGMAGNQRSEERRVGKECRSRWSADQLKIRV